MSDGQSGGVSSCIIPCQIMQEKQQTECSCCADSGLYQTYQSAALPFYSEQAPYSSALPPPGQFMSDMEGTYKANYF